MTEVQFAKQFLTTIDSKTTKYQSNHVFDPQTFQMRIPYTLPKLSHPPHPLPPKQTPPAPPIPGSEPIKSTTTSSQTSTTINTILKSTRNPNFTLHLPNLPASTPLSTLKSQIQSLLLGTINPEKIKLLYNKKPIPASKSTLQDVLVASDGSTDQSTPSEVEFSVMILGGAADPVPNVQTVDLNNEVQEGDKSVSTEKEQEKDTTGAMEGVVSEKESEKDTEKPVVPPAENHGREMLQTSEFWDDLQGFLEQRLRDTEMAKGLRGVFEKAAVSAAL